MKSKHRKLILISLIFIASSCFFLRSSNSMEATENEINFEEQKVMEDRQLPGLRSNSALVVPNSVSFLHGLESGFNGGKHKYLKANFNVCYFKSMEMSKWKLTKRNSFPRSLLRNWLRPSLAAEDSLDGCLQIQQEELSVHKPDIIVGSSWGGGIGLLLVSEGIWSGPIFLVAPALKHFLDVVGGTPKYKWKEIVQRINEKQLGKNICIIHGTKDKVIPYQKSLEMVQEIEGIHLITVQGGNHPLTNYLLTKNNFKKHISECFTSFSSRQSKQI